MNVFYTVLKRKIEKYVPTVPKIVNDPSCRFLGKINGADGPAQWVYKNSRDKLIA